jgi:hypothetical protein
MLHLTSACLVILVLLPGGSVASESDHILEFRPAVRGDLADSDCLLKPPIVDTSLSMAGGRSINLHVGSEDAVPYRVTRDSKLRIRDTTAASASHRPVFEVAVVPEASEAERMMRKLGNHFGCRWLVTLDGNAVDLIAGVKGDRSIPGGLYSSLDTALGAYGRTRDEVSIEVMSQAEGARHQAFWAWRKEMDLWQAACDPDMRRLLEEAHPKEFQSILPLLEKMDCSTPPAAPPLPLESDLPSVHQGAGNRPAPASPPGSTPNR